MPWLARRFRVYAVVRNASDALLARKLGAIPLCADLDRPETLRRLAGIAHCILHTAPPPEQGVRDGRTRRVVAALSCRSSLPQRISYISTTGVYGDCMGGAVPETRPARPSTARAQRRVDAESVLRRFGARHGCNVAILRAPGIYAADRLPIDRLKRGDPVLDRRDDVFTNHVHADDLAQLAGLALFRSGSGRVYNASDDTALRMGDYFDQVADALHLPRPPRVDRSEAAGKLSRATLSFMSESRRIVNARIKRELRARLRYPTVAACLRDLPER